MNCRTSARNAARKPAQRFERAMRSFSRQHPAHWGVLRRACGARQRFCLNRFAGVIQVTTELGECDEFSLLHLSFGLLDESVLVGHARVRSRRSAVEVPADLRARLEGARLDLLALFRALDRMDLTPSEIPQRLIRQLFELDADYAEALWALDQAPGTLDVQAMLRDTQAAIPNAVTHLLSGRTMYFRVALATLGLMCEAAVADARRFSLVAWGVLAYNLLVVLWGAFVRATGSGAGCGNRWPLCNGAMVPRAPRIETIIEFTHRASSGLALVGVAALCIWAWRLFPRGHRARTCAALSAVFLLAEALLGAGLVLFQYVEHNASAGRAAYLSAHLVNTQILLAMLTLTAWFGSDPASRPWPRAPKLVVAALPVAIVVAVSGAIAALGDTLYPPASVAAGMRQEFSETAGTLLRLRAVHPLVAVVGAFVLLAAALAAMRSTYAPAVRMGGIAAALVLLQLAAGAVNIVLLAPVWMQIVHLLLADLLWVALVVTALETGG